MRTSLMAVAGWILATAAAVTVGIFATSTIGNGITDGSVDSLGEDKVAAALASVSDRPTTPASTTQPPQSSSRPSPTPPKSSSGPDPQPVTRILNSPGGSVLARCTGSTVYLVNWTPAQGFTSDDDEHRGPGSSARVKFKSEEEEYRINIACRNGVPESIVERDD